MIPRVLGYVPGRGCLLTAVIYSWFRCCPYRCCECVCRFERSRPNESDLGIDLNSGFIGFPSVGKSTLMSSLTGQHSEGSLGIGSSPCARPVS